MAVVITVAQQKGGAGKSMLVANLAAALTAIRRVAILDIDPQHSLARWHAIRLARPVAAPALTFSDLSGWRLAGELERLRREYDVVLIDSPPDIWAAEGTLRLAAEEKRPACLILNRVSGGSRLRETTDHELRTRGLAVLPAALGNRAAFSHAFAEGLGVTEFAPRSQAATELRALLGAILTMIK